MPLFRGLHHWLECNWSAGSLMGFRRKRRFVLVSRTPKAWHGMEPCQPGPTTVLDVADDGGWSIRILHPVAHAIDADALHWGRWKQEAPWLAVSRLKIEPSPLQALLRHRLTAFARPLVLSWNQWACPKFARCKRGLFRISRFHWHLAQPPERRRAFRDRPKYLAQHRRGCRWPSRRVVGLDSDRTHVRG